MSRLAYIGLGSNLGDRRGTLESSIEALRSQPGWSVRRVSRWVETAALTAGGPAQPDYLNGVVELETDLPAEGVVARLLRIEQEHGRRRTARWGARSLDMDLLLLGDEVVDSPTVTVPHPQMHLRSFVLEPLETLNPELRHPVLGVTVRELSRRLRGRSYSASHGNGLVCLAGVIGAGKTTVARALRESLGGDLIEEPYRENPFLASAIQGDQRLALDAQLFFLLRRCRQLAADRLSPGRYGWVDYWFGKERIFARRLLTEPQWALYEEIYERLAAGVVAPALVIHLEISPRACLARIARRGRAYEGGLRESFLADLAADYRRELARYIDSPVLTLDGEHFDGRDPEQCRWLARQVVAYVPLDQKGKTL